MKDGGDETQGSKIHLKHNVNAKLKCVFPISNISENKAGEKLSLEEVGIGQHPIGIASSRAELSRRSLPRGGKIFLIITITRPRPAVRKYIFSQIFSYLYFQ